MSLLVVFMELAEFLSLHCALIGGLNGGSLGIRDWLGSEPCFTPSAAVEEPSTLGRSLICSLPRFLCLCTRDVTTLMRCLETGGEKR